MTYRHVTNPACEAAPRQLFTGAQAFRAGAGSQGPPQQSSLALVNEKISHQPDMARTWENPARIHSFYFISERGHVVRTAAGQHRQHALSKRPNSRKENLKMVAEMYGSSDAVQAIASVDMLGQLLWNLQLFLRVASSHTSSKATRSTTRQKAGASCAIAMSCTV